MLRCGVSVVGFQALWLKGSVCFPFVVYGVALSDCAIGNRKPFFGVASWELLLMI